MTKLEQVTALTGVAYRLTTREKAARDRGDTDAANSCRHDAELCRRVRDAISGTDQERGDPGLWPWLRRRAPGVRR